MGETVSKTALRIAGTVSTSTVGKLRRRAAAAVAEAGAKEATVDAIRLCVSEALANAALHAYPEGPGLVEVVVELTDGEYVVTVRDYGRGIGGKPGPPEGDGGMGLGIIRRLSRHYRITSGSEDGTEVRMTFARDGEVADPFASPST
jgi:anti-sigma regulatory factor (Ser/Thr protein kinase)